MFDIIHTDKSTIYAVGDIHGEFKAIKNWILDHKLSDCALIFCGDFGLGFDGIEQERKDLLKSQGICEKNNVDCYVIRGNHDDPDYFNNPSKKLDLSRFKTVSDYTVIKSPEHTILCLGGAISTDRKYRIRAYQSEAIKISSSKHISMEKAYSKVKCYWWEKEAFVYDTNVLNEIVESGLNIDTICSHSAPLQCYPTYSSMKDMAEYMEDDNLEADTKRERENFSSVLSFLQSKGQNISNWYYGHFHNHKTETIEGTTFHLLDMGRAGKLSGYPGGRFDMKEL